MDSLDFVDLDFLLGAITVVEILVGIKCVTGDFWDCKAPGNTRRPVNRRTPIQLDVQSTIMPPYCMLLNHTA